MTLELFVKIATCTLSVIAACVSCYILFDMIRTERAMKKCQHRVSMSHWKGDAKLEEQKDSPDTLVSNLLAKVCSHPDAKVNLKMTHSDTDWRCTVELGVELDLGLDHVIKLEGDIARDPKCIRYYLTPDDLDPNKEKRGYIVRFFQATWTDVDLKGTVTQRIVRFPEPVAFTDAQSMTYANGLMRKLTDWYKAERIDMLSRMARLDAAINGGKRALPLTELQKEWSSRWMRESANPDNPVNKLMASKCTKEEHDSKYPKKDYVAGDVAARLRFLEGIDNANVGDLKKHLLDMTKGHLSPDGKTFCLGLMSYSMARSVVNGLEADKRITEANAASIREELNSQQDLDDKMHESLLS